MHSGAFDLHVQCALTLYELLGYRPPQLQTFHTASGKEYQGYIGAEFSKMSKVLGRRLLDQRYRQGSLPEGDSDGKETEEPRGHQA